MQAGTLSWMPAMATDELSSWTDSWTDAFPLETAQWPMANSPHAVARSAHEMSVLGLAAGTHHSSGIVTRNPRVYRAPRRALGALEGAGADGGAVSGGSVVAGSAGAEVGAAGVAAMDA